MQPNENDVKECRRLLALGTTPYVQAFLRAEVSKLEVKFPAEVAPAQVPLPTKVIYEAISSYAFSDAGDKAEIMIRDIVGLENAKIEFKPTPHSFELFVVREGMSNMKLTVAPLYKKIKPDESKFTTRGTTLKVILVKSKSTSWMKVKKTAMDAKKKKPSIDDKADPQSSLMDMMKNMYDEGDDEMKRMISKAMWEGQHKKDGDKPSDAE